MRAIILSKGGTVMGRIGQVVTLIVISSVIATIETIGLEWQFSQIREFCSYTTLCLVLFVPWALALYVTHKDER
jgi:hypothetical protein